MIPKPLQQVFAGFLFFFSMESLSAADLSLQSPANSLPKTLRAELADKIDTEPNLNTDQKEIILEAYLNLNDNPDFLLNILQHANSLAGTLNDYRTLKNSTPRTKTLGAAVDTYQKSTIVDQRKLAAGKGAGHVDEAIKSIAPYLSRFEPIGINVRKFTTSEMDSLIAVKTANSLNPKVNIAKAEVKVGSSAKTDSYATSGYPSASKGNILTEPQGVPHPRQGNSVFESFTSEVDGLSRINDSEVKLLEDFALKNGAIPNVPGQTFYSVKGEMKIFTQLCPCSSCANVIVEFKRMFPNVKIEVITSEIKGF